MRGARFALANLNLSQIGSHCAAVAALKLGETQRVASGRRKHFNLFISFQWIDADLQEQTFVMIDLNGSRLCFTLVE